MKWFRRTLCESRIFILAFLAVELFYLVDGRNYVYAHQVYEQEEARLKEISELLDIPVEKLRPDHESLFDSLRNLFGEEKDPVKEAGLKRLREVLKKHEEKLAANPYLPQIEGVKREHAPYLIEGILQDLLQLTDPPGRKPLPLASKKALLRNLRYSLRERLELPPLPEGVPAKARAKHAAMQAKLDRLFDAVRPILAEAQQEDGGPLAEKLIRLKLVLDLPLERARRAPRSGDRPLPIQPVERKARAQEISEARPSEPSPTIAAKGVLPPRTAIPKTTIAPEIAELAATLGNSPARIFSWVHDNVEYDPKWGALRSPSGTLWEKSGTSWDQAWLLKDLLTAAGVDARFEWGEVEVSPELLTNVTGLDDPWRAGDLLTTAGVPIVLLTQGSQVIAARMSHVWVRAWIDYVPNRGATPGPGDTWVRMDPSLKRHDYAPGIQIHDDVPFELGAYLQSGTELSPRRLYEEALWEHIRANDIACTTLEQLKKAGRIVEEGFPFLPGTLRGKILRVDGEDPGEQPPAGFQQGIAVQVRAATGEPLLLWEAQQAALYGRRIEIDYEGATPDDQATLDAHGGVFNTPPYLVDLKPVVRLDGAEVASGSAIGAAEDVEIFVTFTPVTGPQEVVVHDVYAGEPSVLVADFGSLPQAVIDRLTEVVSSAAASGDEALQQSATLHLIGATYLANLGRDLRDLAGWSWHRLVNLGVEGLVTQTANVDTALDGSPISFTRAGRSVDFARMLLGLFHATGQDQFRKSTLELAGAQGSFLEGEVFEQTIAQRGIAAVSALTQSQRRGQTLQQVDATNVDSVLAAVDLGQDVEDGVRAAVAQGKIAFVAETEIGVGSWTGTGYVIEDPTTGAAGYLITGGLAGGTEIGVALERLQDLLGSEPWLGALLQLLLALFGGGEGGDGDDGPSTNQSDPLNLSTGNLWMTEVDLTIQAKGLPIIWDRTYNSRSTYSGPLGHGWTFGYGERLEEQPDGSVLYREGDGTEHLFTTDGGGGYEAPPGKHLTLVRDASEWSLRTKDGFVTSFALDGRMLSMSEPNGNTVTLGYDASGNLATVTDAAGRTVLTVTTQDGRITGLTDLAGRSVAYAYTGDDLTAVTDTVGETWSYGYDADHNLVAKSNPLGHTDTYAYDALDRCVLHADPTGATETFSYASAGSKGVVTDRRGYDRYLEFDARGRATLEVDPLGNASRATWDEDNNRTSTTDPRGGVTTRTFDDNGNRLSETDPLGRTTAYSYEPTLNRLVTTTDPTGHVVTRSYDSRGNLLETREVVGGETITETFTYDADGQLESQTDARGETASFTWDATNGSVASQTDPAGNVTTLTTDALGRLTAISDPAGNDVTVTWDEKDRLVGLVDPFGNESSITYDAAGRQTRFTTPQGARTTEYDAAGRLLAVTDRQGNVMRAEYDAAGNRVVRIDARGNRTATTYDPVGRVSAQVDPLGGVWSFGYCAEIGGGGCGAGGCGGEAPGNGSFCELTDPLGNTNRQDFDALGRVIRRIDPEGNVSTIEYDPLGRQSAVADALGRTTRYEYDDLGRLTAVVEANGARTEYTYDSSGNLTETRDAEGRTWAKTYNDLGRLVTQSDPLSHVTTYRYDALGNLVEKTNPDGESVLYEHDVRRLTAVVLPGGVRETFGYDAQGRRTSVSNAEVSLSLVYDALSRVTEVSNHTLGQTIRYGYDENGNRTSMEGPLGTVRYRYDAKDRLVEQEDPATGVYRLEYDAADRRVSLRYPNGVVTETGYDAASRLALLVTRDPQGQVLDGYRYTYDPVGNRTSMRSLREDVLHEYAYDVVNRLTDWQRGPDRFEQYTYDQVGNRLALHDERGTVTYSYDLANRLLEEVRELSAGGSTTTAYTWDPDGDLLEKSVSTGSVTTYTWDALHRLTAVAGPTGTDTYGYDPNGTRVRETHGADTTRFLHAGEDILAAYSGGSLDVYYTHGPGIDEPWSQAMPGGSTPLAYLHRDGLGSITAISSPEGVLQHAATYTPFGSVETAPPAFSARYGFTSRELDPTGLMYYRARYYQPDVGRFTSRDPFPGQFTTPSSLHGYTYVGNRPTAFTDPSGAEPDDTESLQIVGDWFYIGLLVFLSPYLLILALLARIALRAFAPIAIKYFVAITSWMYVFGLILSEWLISARGYFGNQIARFNAYITPFVILGAAVYFSGVFYFYRLVGWVSNHTSILAFTVFLYWTCANVLPSTSFPDMFFSRSTVICAAILVYIWAVANLPRPPPRLGD